MAANYFDDYPVVEFGGLATNTESTLRAVSKLLGFTVASDKELPFSRKADMLGVTVDLADDTLSKVLVCNKESRVAEMADSLRADTSRTPSMSRALEPSLDPDGFELVAGGSSGYRSFNHVDALNDGFEQSGFQRVVSFSSGHAPDGSFLQSDASDDGLPGPTVADSVDESGLFPSEGNLFGSPVNCDTLRHDLQDFLGDVDNGSAPVSDSADRDVDWLLDLGPAESAARDLHTGRLDRDRQARDTMSSPSLPGFGVDNSAWALGIEQPKFFWETDPFLSTIFGKTGVLGPELKRPAVDIDLTSREPDDVMSLLRRPKQTRVAGLCEQVIKHVEIRDEQDKRQSIISNWTSIVCISLDAFGIGDAIIAGGEQATHENVEASLRACFARKATSTLAKRFYALNKFVNFCSRNGMQMFPLREHVVFSYLQAMIQDERTSASAGRSFLEACRFAQGILGLRGDLTDLGTSRVDGAAVELSKRAGPIRQASPLRVGQVIALEKLVANSPDLKDRVTYGAMLILLYSCGRFSDGQRSVSLIMDVSLGDIDPGSVDCPGFFELQVLGNKGARSDILRRTFLPLVAPVFSLASVEWFRSWIQAREALGLETNGKLTSPLMCRFGPDGRPLQQEVTSSECGRLLRKALKIDESEGLAIRSHSLKATALSWAGKFGLSLETRRLLGHHLDAGAKSAETYNRDSMGPAIEQMVKTLQAIKRGAFFPDSSRSGRFVASGGTQAETLDRAETDEQSSDSDSTFEPDSEESSDSDDDVFAGPSESSLLWHLVAPELRPGFIDVPDSFTVFRNNVSGVQHLKPNGGIKFLCGRRECDRYTYFAGKPVKGVAMCEHCIGSKDLASQDVQ
eukprot:s2670_g10.t1